MSHDPIPIASEYAILAFDVLYQTSLQIIRYHALFMVAFRVHKLSFPICM